MVNWKFLHNKSTNYPDNESTKVGRKIWHDIQIPFAGNAGGKILNYFSKVIAAILISAPLIGGDTRRDNTANVAAENRRITVFSCVKSKK
jgi:hypothetical protein